MEIDPDPKDLNKEALSRIMEVLQQSTKERMFP